MGKIGSFEEIEAWKAARKLFRDVSRSSGKGSFARDFVIRDQMRRAALSIPSNIAEGFERGGDREFAQFLAQAKGSAGELRSQLHSAFDLGYLEHDGYHCLLATVLDISRRLAALISYLQGSSLRGSRFRDRPAGSSS